MSVLFSSHRRIAFPTDGNSAKELPVPCDLAKATHFCKQTLMRSNNVKVSKIVHSHISQSPLADGYLGTLYLHLLRNERITDAEWYLDRGKAEH